MAVGESGTMTADRTDAITGLGKGNFFLSASQWFGALLSFALIWLAASWAYDLWHRDISGVPVVAALEGPPRIRPQDPGGMTIEHQGFAVNRIAEESPVETLPERLVLAPEASRLAAEDGPVARPEAVIANGDMTPSVQANIGIRTAVDDALKEVLGYRDESAIPTSTISSSDGDLGTSLRPVPRPSSF
jgi:hypothetical protein